MSRLPEVPEEAILSSALADAISTLSALESYEPGTEKDFDFSWVDGGARNNATALNRMQWAVATLVEKKLAELQQEAIAWARGNVTKARDALRDFYARQGTPQAAPGATEVHTGPYSLIRFYRETPVDAPTAGETGGQDAAGSVKEDETVG